MSFIQNLSNLDFDYTLVVTKKQGKIIITMKPDDSMVKDEAKNLLKPLNISWVIDDKLSVSDDALFEALESNSKKANDLISNMKQFEESLEKAEKEKSEAKEKTKQISSEKTKLEKIIESKDPSKKEEGLKIISKIESIDINYDLSKIKEEFNKIYSQPSLF